MPFTPCDPNAASCTDVSVGILTKIFGDAIQLLAVGADPSSISPAGNVFASMMQYFNSGIMVLAGLLMSYIMTVGIVNTANDGEALGKNWSSVWTPLRAVSGLGAMLPSASGYSYIQILVLSLSLWAIGFANGLYKIGVENGIIGGNLNSISSEFGMGSSATPNPQYPLYDLRKFASDFLAIAWCEKVVTEIYTANVSTGTIAPIISIRTDNQPDSMQMESMYKRGDLYLFKDRTDGNLAGGSAICGSIKMYEYFTPGAITVWPDAGSAFDSSTINSNATAMMAIRTAALNAKKAAAIAMMAELTEWVVDWPADLDVPEGQPNWDTVKPDRFNEIVNKAQSNLEVALKAQINNDTVLKSIMAKYVDDVTKDGWSMAGGFYQRLGGIREEMTSIFSEVIYDATKPDLSGVPDDLLGQHVKLSYSTVYDQVISKTLTGASFSNGSLQADLTGFSSLFGTDIQGLSVDAIGNRGSSSMNAVVGDLMQGTINKLVGTDGHVDMLARIKTVGDSLKVAESTLNSALYVITLSIDTGEIAAASADSIKVAGTGVNSAPVVQAVRRMFKDAFADYLVQVAEWLGKISFWFSIFIPTLPYFIFMMAVVGWILSIFQAIVAAPLWAIMHMTPERSFVGGQTQGYLLLLSLFARPPLIVIGLFAAILAANPIIQYVTIFFFAVRSANVNSSESLGWFMQFITFKDWLLMYAFVVTPIIYMVFGLSQMLPDTVLTWIGAGIKSMGETNATNEMRNAGMSHDASNSGSAGNLKQRLQRDSMGKLPPRALALRNNKGADPSYGAGLQSGNNPPSGGGGGGRSVPLANANPQGVSPVKSDRAGSANKSQTSTKSESKSSSTESDYKIKNSGESKSDLMANPQGVLPRQIDDQSI